VTTDERTYLDGVTDDVIENDLGQNVVLLVAADDTQQKPSVAPQQRHRVELVGPGTREPTGHVKRRELIQH